MTSILRIFFLRLCVALRELLCAGLPNNDIGALQVMANCFSPLLTGAGKRLFYIFILEMIFGIEIQGYDYNMPNLTKKTDLIYKNRASHQFLLQAEDIQSQDWGW